jgi:hypothetical protein
VPEDDGRLRQILLDELDHFTIDGRRLFELVGRWRPLFPRAKMSLDQHRRLILRQVPDDDQDRLIWQVFPGVKLLDVRNRNFVERLFRAMGRPAVRMAVKNQLVEGFHRHVSGIIVITDDFAEDLRADAFDFLLMKRRMLEHIG